MSGEPPKKSVLSNRNRRRGSGKDGGSKGPGGSSPQTPSPSKLSSDSLQEHYGQTEIRKALFGKPQQQETLHTLIAGELEFSGAGMGASSPTGSGLDAMGSASVGRVMEKTYAGPADAVADLRSDGGQLLPSAIRQQAERGLGRDLGSVRLHTDSTPQLDAMGAEAAADGRHVHIDPSQVDLTTAKGKGTLFHELTHVAQAQEGRLPQHGVTSDRGMQTEVEAREVGTLLGRQSATSNTGNSPPQATQMSHLIASTANVMATTLFTRGSDASFDVPGAGWESLVDASLGGVPSYNEFGSMNASVDVGAPVQTRAEGAAPESAVAESSSAPVMLSEKSDAKLFGDRPVTEETPNPVRAQSALGSSDSPAPPMLDGEFIINKMAGGVAIGGSSGVSPTAVDNLARSAHAMFGGNENLMKALADSGVSASAYPHDVGLTEQAPELTGETTHDGRTWDDVDGVAKDDAKNVLINAKELVQIPGEEQPQASVASVHELAHMAHRHGLGEKEQALVERRYERNVRKQDAGKQNALVSPYAKTTSQEFFATATQAYLGVSGREANGADWVKQADPKLYRLLERTYGSPEEVWKRAEGYPMSHSE